MRLVSSFVYLNFAGQFQFCPYSEKVALLVFIRTAVPWPERQHLLAFLWHSIPLHQKWQMLSVEVPR